MRVAIITESFPPDVNGVANSVVRVAEHLVACGHDPLVIAPQPALGRLRVAAPTAYPVIRIASIGLPGYPGFRLGLPARRVVRELRAHGTEVVHLASPFVLGAWGSAAAASLGLPMVAVYQTDVPGYSRHYRMGWGERAAWRWLRRIHSRAARTLAPSSSTAAELVAHGIADVWLWRRGVDSTLFHPRQRDEATRRALAPDGEVLVGYVGRLAVEKRVDLLGAVADLPGVRLVVVGDGPARSSLEAMLPGAVFVGERHGAQLARLYASLDIFAHTGPLETFGQAIQEALASGVPVVATAAGGPLDLVQPGRTGLLVPPADGVALAAAVNALVVDPVRRAQYGVAARAAVQARTWSAVGDELIAHYRAVRRLSTTDELAALERAARPAPTMRPTVPSGPTTRRARASIGGGLAT